MTKADLMGIIESNQLDIALFRNTLKTPESSEFTDNDWEDLISSALDQYQIDMHNVNRQSVIDCLLDHLKETEDENYFSCLCACVHRFFLLRNQFKIPHYQQALGTYETRLTQDQLTLAHIQKLAQSMNLQKIIDRVGIYLIRYDFFNRYVQALESGQISQSQTSALMIDQAGTKRTLVAFVQVRLIFGENWLFKKRDRFKADLRKLKALGVNLECKTLLFDPDGNPMSAAQFIMKLQNGFELMKELLAEKDPVITLVEAEDIKQYDDWNRECERKRVEEERDRILKRNYRWLIGRSTASHLNGLANEWGEKLRVRYVSYSRGFDDLIGLNSILGVIREKTHCTIEQVISEFSFQQFINDLGENALSECFTRGAYILGVVKLKNMELNLEDAVKKIPDSIVTKAIINIIDEFVCQYGCFKSAVYLALPDNMKDGLELNYIFDIAEKDNQNIGDMLTPTHRSVLQKMLATALSHRFNVNLRDFIMGTPPFGLKYYDGYSEVPDKTRLLQRVGSYEKFLELGIDGIFSQMATDHAYRILSKMNNHIALSVGFMTSDFLDRRFEEDIDNTPSSLYELTYYIHIKASHSVYVGSPSVLKYWNIIGACVMALDPSCRPLRNINFLSSPVESFIKWMINPYLKPDELEWIPEVIVDGKTLMQDVRSRWYQGEKTYRFPVLKRLSYMLSKDDPAQLTNVSFVRALQDCIISKIRDNTEILVALRDQLYSNRSSILSLTLQFVDASDVLSKNTHAYKTVIGLIHQIKSPVSKDVILGLDSKINSYKDASVHDVILYLASLADQISADEFHRILTSYLNKDFDLASKEHQQVIDALLLLPEDIAKAFKQRVRSSVLLHDDDLRKQMAELCTKKTKEANQNLIWHIVSAGKTTAEPKSTGNLDVFKSGLLSKKSLNPFSYWADDKRQADVQADQERRLNVGL
ncbi:MAG TPA: hypothetical protein VFU82_00240 [Gammaproteobacteria bacterium]|nr:hypothetical protein [Gammaproteobacteria bacterium]